LQVSPVNFYWLRCAMTLSSVFALLIATPTMAMSFGASIGITSDYLVRGISRSNHNPSLQADVHASLGQGFDAGLFAASVQIAPNQQHNTELSGFVGFARDIADAWHSRIAINHYSYPWNAAGSQYDYDELDLDVTYQQWLTLSAMYSPNTPRYLPPWGISSVTAKAIEVSAQAPLSREFFLIGGVGYAHVAGRFADGYTYWSGGGQYSLGKLSFSLQYIGSAGAATQLYYDSAAHNRVVGTVIWHF